MVAGVLEPAHCRCLGQRLGPEPEGGPEWELEQKEELVAVAVAVAAPVAVPVQQAPRSAAHAGREWGWARRCGRGWIGGRIWLGPDRSRQPT